MKAELQQKLDEMVSSKIITDKQKDSIINYFCDDFDKMKNHQAGQAFDKGVPGRDERHNFLNVLVRDGVISREQADIIRKAIIQPPVPLDQEPNLEHPQP